MYLYILKGGDGTIPNMLTIGSTFIEICGTMFKKKHCKNCKKLPREHFIGCQGVKLFLLKDVMIATVTTASVTTVTITTVTI